MLLLLYNVSFSQSVDVVEVDMFLNGNCVTHFQG